LVFFSRPFQDLAGTGGLIEKTFRQRVVSSMKAFDPNYAEWQVPVTYRAIAVEEKVIPALPLARHGSPVEHSKAIDLPTAPCCAGDSPGVLAVSSHPMFTTVPLPFQKSEI
jgi:hypothetical protein